jgi:hypothetical protein
MEIKDKKKVGIIILVLWAILALVFNLDTFVFEEPKPDDKIFQVVDEIVDGANEAAEQLYTTLGK